MSSNESGSMMFSGTMLLRKFHIAARLKSSHLFSQRLTFTSRPLQNFRKSPSLALICTPFHLSVFKELHNVDIAQKLKEEQNCR